jgi:putative ABC transport system permease protein
VTGGPLRIDPQMNTPLRNSVVDAHSVEAEIEGREDVAVATSLAFQAVYVGRNTSEFRLLTGVGLQTAAEGKGIAVQEGRGLEGGDPHYANGTYEGPMTHEVVIDSRTADLMNVSVGETLYIGGSKSVARKHAFTVVGTSQTFSRFLGTPTLVLYLSELQEITGTTQSDRATFITVKLQPDVDVQTAQADLQRAYPEYDVRTNREQLRTLVQDKTLVIASAAALVFLAVVAGIGLMVNLLMLVVYQQQHELAALRALGFSRGLLVGLVATQGILLGVLGGAVGLAATPVAVVGLNHVAYLVVGFESLLRTPVLVYAGGAVLAVGIGTIGAVIAGWHIARLPPLPQLQE